MQKTKQQLRELLEPSVESMGYELLHIEFATQGKNRVLRLYIDAPGGILVEDCALVSRQLSAVLDVEEPMSSAYLLEVSSPGLDRPLVTLAHFKKFQGEFAKISMYTHVLGRRRFTGQMVEVGEVSVVLEVDGESYELPYCDIESARLEPVFE